MKKYTILFYVLTMLSACAQPASETRKLKIFMVKNCKPDFLIGGINLNSQDSVYFVSLSDHATSKSEKVKIEIGGTYEFRIKDVDNINGHLPAALPNGYWLKIDDRRVKRDSRNGRTVTTTQYFSENTDGEFVFK